VKKQDALWRESANALKLLIEAKFGLLPSHVENQEQALPKLD
jgi:hypothetical protein